MKLKVLISFVVLLVLIQFVPFGKNHSNPPVTSEPAWDSPETAQLFARACGDCHSHKTVWPWYSNYAPISWLVANDVYEGREHFNVSMWNTQKRNKGKEAAEAIEEGEMPPWFYLIPHPEAKLSDQETAALIKGLEKTFGRKH